MNDSGAKVGSLDGGTGEGPYLNLKDKRESVSHVRSQQRTFQAELFASAQTLRRE